MTGAESTLRDEAAALLPTLLRRILSRPVILRQIAAEPALLDRMLAYDLTPHLQGFLKAVASENAALLDARDALDGHLRLHSQGEYHSEPALFRCFAVVRLVTPCALLTLLILPYATASPFPWLWPVGVLGMVPIPLWFASRRANCDRLRAWTALLTGRTLVGTALITISCLATTLPRVARDSGTAWASSLIAFTVGGNLLLVGYLCFGIWGTSRPLVMHLRRSTRRTVLLVGARTPLSAIEEALAPPQPGRLGIPLFCSCGAEFNTECPAVSPRWLKSLELLRNTCTAAQQRWEDGLASHAIMPLLIDRFELSDRPRADGEAIWPTTMRAAEFCARLRALLAETTSEQALLRIADEGPPHIAELDPGLALTMARDIPGLLDDDSTYVRFDLSIGSATLIGIPRRLGEPTRFILANPPQPFASALNISDLGGSN